MRPKESTHSSAAGEHHRYRSVPVGLFSLAVGVIITNLFAPQTLVGAITGCVVAFVANHCLKDPA